MIVVLFHLDLPLAIAMGIENGRQYRPRDIGMSCKNDTGQDLEIYRHTAKYQNTLLIICILLIHVYSIYLNTFFVFACTVCKLLCATATSKFGLE